MNVPAPHNEKQTITIPSFNIRLTDQHSCPLSFTVNAALDGEDM